MFFYGRSPYKLNNARYSICMHKPLQLWDYIFRKWTMHCLLVAASLSFTKATNHMMLRMSEEVFQQESYTTDCKVNVITVPQLKELQLYMCTTAKSSVNTHHETCFKCIMCCYHLNISFKFLYRQNITKVWKWEWKGSERWKKHLNPLSK